MLIWELLTEREKDIARLMAKGLESKEIGERLGISVRTVEALKQSLYSKVGADNAIKALIALYHFVPRCEIDEQFPPVTSLDG